MLTVDAAEYEIRSDENVFYLYNPFEAPVLRSIVERIAASAAQDPRPIWIIYNHPLHKAVLDEAAGFIPVLHRELRDSTFAVYLSRP